MPYRKIFFEENQPIHIFSRAVEKREIFKDEVDCYRFIFQLYTSNVGKPVHNLWRADIIKAAKSLLQGEEISSNFVVKEHSPLVHILDFALVVNHYHLCLVPNFENSVPQYMKKLNGGFAKYFNLKYTREGALFGSRYKSVLIETEFQVDAVHRYISVVNPLDVYQPGWRENGLQDIEGAFRFLENYKFSSFPEIIGKRNSKILAPDEVLENFFFKKEKTGQNEYLNFIEDFLKHKLTSFSPLFLE